MYTFYFYIAFEELKIYQKYLIKKVPDFPFHEKFIRDILNNFLRNYFLEGLKMVTVSTISRTHIPTGCFFTAPPARLKFGKRLPYSEECGHCSCSLSSFTTPGLQSLEGWIVHNMLKTVTSRALLVAVAIASVAELKRKETVNLKPNIDIIIAKWSPDVSLSCSARISVTQKSDHSSCPAASGRRSAWWRFLPSPGVLSSS